MKFGDFIRDRRVQLGWTQPDAAAKVGIEQSYLSKLENSRSKPSAEVFARLCEAYKIDSATVYAAIDDAAVEELLDIEEIRQLAAAAATHKRSEAFFWRAFGVIALALGAALVAGAQIGPNEESRFVYRSTGVIQDGEPLGVFDNLDEASPEIVSRIDEATRSRTDYQGPHYIEPVEQGRRIWMLAGGETVTVRAWMRWLGIPGLAFLVAGVAALINGWRRA